MEYSKKIMITTNSQLETVSWIPDALVNGKQASTQFSARMGESALSKRFLKNKKPFVRY